MSGSPTFDIDKKNRNGANLRLRHALRAGGVIIAICLTLPWAAMTELKSTSYPGSFFGERKDPGRSWSRDAYKIDCLRGYGQAKCQITYASTSGFYTSIARSECSVQSALRISYFSKYLLNLISLYFSIMIIC